MADYIISKGLIKPLRDIGIQDNGKNLDTLNSINLSKLIAKILNNTGLIGQLTMSYYRADIAKELLDNTISLDIYFKGIEAVIKSVKKRMDLSILETADRLLEKDLRNIIPDVWRELKWLPSMEAIFSTDEDINVKMDAFISKFHIEDPLHYMDYLWNECLELSKKEVAILQKNTLPLKSFSDLIVPQIIDDREEHLKGISVLQKLNGMFGQSFKEGQRFFGKNPLVIETTKGVSSELEDSSVAEFAKTYLERSQGTGMFLGYLYRLSDVVDNGGTVRVKIKNGKYEEAVNLLLSVSVDTAQQAISDVITSDKVRGKFWRRRQQDMRVISSSEFPTGTVIEIKRCTVNGAFVDGVPDGRYVVLSAKETHVLTNVNVELQKVG
jgi:hypothetical protein